MNRLILFLTATFFTVASLNVVAQEWKAGFVDIIHGNFVVFPQYDEIRDLYEGLVAVENDGLWGFVDKNGKVIIQPQYSYVRDFHEGLAAVSDGGLMGFVDKNGKVIIKPQYSYVDDFHEGLAKVERDNKWGFVDKTGEEVIPLRYCGDCGASSFVNGFAKIYQDNKEGMIDKTGRVIIPPRYDMLFDPIEGLVEVRKDNKYGLVDTTGREVVSPVYDGIWHHRDYVLQQDYGLFSVVKDNKIELVNKTGKVIVPPYYDQIGGFNEGLARVKKDDKYGFIDNTGRVIVPLRYYGARDYRNGLAFVYSEFEGVGVLYSFIDKTGKEVIPPRYTYVNPFDKEGYATAERLGMLVLVDKTGREIVSPSYDYYYYDDTGGSEFRKELQFIFFYEDLMAVSKDGKVGFIDRTGKEVIPLKYDYASSFHEGRAIVKKDDKFGFIDKTGKEIVPLKYDDAKPYHEGRTVVKKDGRWWLIDKTGNEIIHNGYDDIDYLDVREGFVVVTLHDKDGLVNLRTAKEVVPPRYDGMGSPVGLIWVKLNGKEGFIDNTGKEVIPPCFEFDRSLEHCGFFPEGLLLVYVKTNDAILFESYNRKVQQTWAECKKKLHNCPYNTGKIQFDSALSISFFLNPRLESITDSIVSEIKRKTSDLMDYCVLFENCDNKIQSTWKECNQQLMDYPYNVEKLQLEPVSITNFFLDPRLDAITDSIVSDLKQKSSELLVECYNNLKTKKPKVFSEIYLEQHPEAKSVLENLKLECRCNNYSEAELVVRIADNNIPKCTCRSDYWNQYGNLFSSRAEFDNTYNTSEQSFLDDVKLRQSLKADIQNIASMLSGLKTPKFKDGLTGKNESVIQLLQKVQYHKGEYFYDEVVEMMFAADASMTKEWEKNGSLFSSKNEFYEAYVSGDYKNVLKEKKSK